ncbi:hypothetical protein [Methylobacter sp. YRD-M1]|uniref:hypothetical protein n=1 Tax=Methylobacter sp. YRD-M1 TaxID=2911520 RepID=UPI00227AEB86|nr:hypothetical protein [Methylobacter sp. YRD-M1]WAK01112.1 hypothetical protein LZ558_14900 [Methylobacter sp. YRD-M1]
MVTITIRQLIIGALLLTALLVCVRWQLESSPRPQPQPTSIKRQPARVASDKFPAREPAQQLEVSEDYGDPALKEAYFCDLARSLRERCERIPRSAESLEFCLKATGYYTNSRHCGYRP